MIEISKVTSYAHLFGFLRCYPFIQKLKIHFSKVQANLILDAMCFLQPSLNEVIIFAEQPADLADIDLSFMRLLKLVILKLDSSRLPVQLIRKVAAKQDPLCFRGLFFEDVVTTDHRMMVCFDSSGNFLLVDASCDRTLEFRSIEQFISAVQKDPHLSTLFLI